MLVQSRSKACAVCQKRKLKCDKLRPKCSQCIKDGWDCPGYLLLWKTKPRSSKTRPYEQQWLLRNSGTSPPRTHSKALSRSSLKPIKANRLVCTQPNPSALLNDTSYNLSKRLVYLLKNVTVPHLKIQNLGSFLESIPPRLGFNQALDDAVQCICTAYTCILSRNELVARQDRTEYYTALRSLRSSVENEDEALSSNVLGAAVLLSWYEILADNLDDGWLAHIKGCAQLIQLRGPSRHQAAFDQELLYAQEGLISADALMRHEPSFLDSPIWRDTLRGLEQSLSEQVFATALKESNERMARLSTLLRDCDVILQSAGAEQVQLDILPVFHRVVDLQSEINEHLASHAFHTTNSEYQDSTAILDSKQALALLVINTSLLKLLGFVGAVEELQIPTPLPHQLEGNENGATCLRRTQIENDIDKIFTLLHKSLLIARKATPFSTRKMAFMCRVMCADMRLRVDRHPVWDQLGDLIDAINCVPCLANI